MATGIVASIRIVQIAQILLLVRDPILLSFHDGVMEPPVKAVGTSCCFFSARFPAGIATRIFK
jgi:hypothetical protein